MRRRLSEELIDPADPPARKIERLLDITDALIRHAEQGQGEIGGAFESFRRSASLEELVRQRTHDLETMLKLLNEANAGAERARRDLARAIEAVQEGFALFDSARRLVMHNSRFCRELPDVRPYITPGISFDEYVRLISLSRNLALPPGTAPADWVAQRLRQHKAGRRFNVELTGDRWLQVSEQRTADRGIVVLQTDVTGIIRAERSERGKLLDQQSRMIHATLEHINQGVAIFSPGAQLVGSNGRLCQLLDLPEELLQKGTTFATLAGHLSRHVRFRSDFSALRLLKWLREDGKRLLISFELQHESGIVLDVFAQGMPEGGFVMSFTDVTREKMAIHSMRRANASLEERVAARTSDLAVALREAELAHAARVRFVAAASHDLLQPLSAAKLFVAAARDMAEPGRPAQTLEKAHNALISVEAILGALLDLSRLEAASSEIEVAPIALSVLLGQLTDEFAPVAARRGLTFRIMPCGLAVESNPAYLRRILQNLISNALRYTERGGVLVGVRRLAGIARVEIHDTGPGIAPEDQKRIFGEFQRLQGSASAAEGMGLGLAIVERACALLKHPLHLHSLPGRGTTFAVDLPLAAISAKPPFRPEAPVIAEEPGTGGDRIALLVENDRDLRRAISLLLERRGVSVLEAENGEAALQLLDEIGIVPDIYLLDQQLGSGMTGVETAVALRAQYGARPTRIITANRTVQTRAVAAEAGLEIMFKPIDAEALAAFVLAAD